MRKRAARAARRGCASTAGLRRAARLQSTASGAPPAVGGASTAGGACRSPPFHGGLTPRRSPSFHGGRRVPLASSILPPAAACVVTPYKVSVLPERTAIWPERFRVGNGRVSLGAGPIESNLCSIAVLRPVSFEKVDPGGADTPTRSPTSGGEKCHQLDSEPAYRGIEWRCKPNHCFARRRVARCWS